MFPKELTRQVRSGPEYPVVETKYGRLRGIETEGTFIFRGVQYAKAARFQMPEEPDCWAGVRNARVYGPACVEISASIPADSYASPRLAYPQSEDCQVLNIWSQSIDPAAKQPVMVWVHGGGYHTGSSAEFFSCDGENLSRFGDVVVVSLNHRLHALGYLDLSSYDRERYRFTGNLGTADIIMALRWIQENIRAFGGDPDNVMLFGQSSGAGKIQMLLQTPAADGLYHKISLQSGAAGRGKPDVTPEDARLTAEYVVSHLGLTARNIREIESVPFHKLAWAVCRAREQYEKEQKQRFDWMPVTDGTYYVGNGLFHGFREETRFIPAIIGNVLGEFESNIADPLKAEYGWKCTWDASTAEKRLRMKFGNAAEEICRLFSAAYPDMPVVNAMFTSMSHRKRHVDVSTARAACGAAVYNWLLTLELPADGGSTPWHNADEAFVFHNASYMESTFIPGVTDVLEDQMAGAWVAFARTGDPNHPNLPKWTPVTESRMATMRFDKVCRMLYDHDRQYMELACGLEQTGAGSGGYPHGRM